MNFNWGKGIVIAYAVFLAGLAVMISISISKDVELVTTNYYDKEIKYQDEINRINNTNKLKKSVDFIFSEQSILFQFPNNNNKSKISGIIYFYRPSDSKKDFKVNIETDENYTQKINIAAINTGLWKIKIHWSMDGVDYFNETSFVKQ